ncbi:hypothetical protein BDBG_16752, partial [Blastomyces gilchristii SLH14081]
ILRDSSLIDNEIVKMHCDARIIDRESRHIHIYLVRDCVSRREMIIGSQSCRRYWQHQKLHKN